MSKHMQEFMVFHDLESNPSGSQLAKWPLHLTIVPPYCLDIVHDEDANRLIYDIGKDFGPFKIEFGEQKMYGKNNDIPVIEVIDKNYELQFLHDELIHCLGEIGCRFIDLSYSLKNYSPHVSNLQPSSFSESEYICSSISIAEKSLTDKLIINKINLI